MISLEKQIVDKLTSLKWQISFAESCTGGLLAATLVNASGASNVLSESYVTYSEEAKQKILNVRKETLSKYSVYSAEVALEMAEGLHNITKADVCISITGEAESSNPLQRGCKCYFAMIIKGEKFVSDVTFTGSRNEVRAKQTNYLFKYLLERLPK